MFPHAFPDGLLELGSLEQGRPVRNPRNRLVRLEDSARHAYIDFLAGFEVEAETSEHDSNQTAGARAGNQVEMVAWFGDLVATRWFALAFDVGAVHEFLKNDEHGVAANTASICSGQLRL